MITVKVNNEPIDVRGNCSIADALILWGYRSVSIAVAINNEFVPRSTYGQHILLANDCVDIVTPVQGG